MLHYFENLCDVAVFFQSHPNDGTWSIGFDISLTYTIEGIKKYCTLKSTVFIYFCNTLIFMSKTRI